jgi:hypothetical protein
MFTDVEDLVPTTASPASERHGAAKDPTRPPPGAAADWTVPQNWDELGAEEHAVWDLLFARQQKALAGRAVNAFEQGLEVLRLGHPGVPEFGELNERLFGRTGWTVVAVPGLVPDDVFFEHLRHRRFPAGNFIRKRSQLDYLEEPGRLPRRVRPRAPCSPIPRSPISCRGLASSVSRRWRRRTAPAGAALLVHGRVRPRPRGRPAQNLRRRDRVELRREPLLRSRAPSRIGSPSTSTGCCAPNIAPTASRSPIS